MARTMARTKKLKKIDAEGSQRVTHFFEPVPKQKQKRKQQSRDTDEVCNHKKNHKSKSDTAASIVTPASIVAAAPKPASKPGSNIAKNDESFASENKDRKPTAKKAAFDSIKQAPCKADKPGSNVAKKDESFARENEDRKPTAKKAAFNSIKQAPGKADNDVSLLLPLVVCVTPRTNEIAALKSVFVSPAQEFDPTTQCSDLHAWVNLSSAKIPSQQGFQKVLCAGSTILENCQRLRRHLAPCTGDIFGRGILNREVGHTHAAQLRVHHPPGSTNEIASKGERTFVAAAAKSLSGSDTVWNINKPGANATLMQDRSICCCVVLALVKCTESEHFPWRFMGRNAVECNLAVEVLVVCKKCWMVQRASILNVKNGILMPPKNRSGCEFVCSSKHALEGFSSQDCDTHRGWKTCNPRELPNPRMGHGTHVFVWKGNSNAACLHPGCMKQCQAWCADEECKLKKFIKVQCGKIKKATSKCGVHCCGPHRAFHHKSVQSVQNKEP